MSTKNAPVAVGSEVTFDYNGKEYVGEVIEKGFNHANGPWFKIKFEDDEGKTQYRTISWSGVANMMLLSV